MENPVWVRLKRHKSGGEDTVYHTDENCRYVTEGHGKKPKDVIDERWRECEVCKHGYVSGAKEQKPALRNQL